jgi:hypothetical protein
MRFWALLAVAMLVLVAEHRPILVVKAPVQCGALKMVFIHI